MCRHELRVKDDYAAKALLNNAVLSVAFIRLSVPGRPVLATKAEREMSRDALSPLAETIRTSRGVVNSRDQLRS